MKPTNNRAPVITTAFIVNSIGFSLKKYPITKSRQINPIINNVSIYLIIHLV